MGHIILTHTSGKKYSDRDNRYLDLAKNPEEYKKPITAEDIQTLRSIGKKSINEFTSEDIQKASKWAYKFYQELGTKSPFFRAWFGDWRANDNSKVSIVNVETTNISKSNLKYGNYRINDTNWDVYAGRTLKKDTTHHFGGERINVKSLFAIKSILENAVLFDTITSENDTDTKAKYTAFLHKLVTPINYNGKILLAITTIEEYYNDSTNEAERRAYHIKAIKIESADGRLEKISTSPMSDTDSNISISDLFKLVKTYDKEFSPKAVNPALLNEDGTPKVFYHGTSLENGDFTVFDESKAKKKFGHGMRALGKGNYFTSNDLSDNKRYGKGRIIDAYLHLNQPIIVDGESYESAVNRILNDDISKYSSDDIQIMLREKGYDGVIVSEPNGNYIVNVFDSNNIKSATDNIGTFDSTNPDIRYSDRDNSYLDLAKNPEEYKKPITAEDIQTLRDIGKKSINEFTSEDIQKAAKWAYKFYQELGTKSPFFRAWFGDWRAYDTKTKIGYVKVNDSKISASDISRAGAENADTGWLINVSRNGIDETANKNGVWSNAYHSLKSINDMLTNAILLDTVVVNKPSKRLGENTAFVHSMYCPVVSNGKKSIAKLYVTEEIGDMHNFYLTKIEMVPTDSRVLSNKAFAPNSSVDTDVSIADLYDIVNILDDNFESDSKNPTKFNPKPVNPLMLNDNGTPKLFYHGAKKSGGFTAFHDWQYFTDNKNYAQRYTERDNPKSFYEVYLKANKVFDTRDSQALNIFKKIRQEYGLGEIQDTGLPDWTDGYDISDYLDNHPELGYDAIILDEGGDLVNGEPVSRWYSVVIKNASQIKSATDNIGTFDSANPDIRYSDRNPNETVAEIEARYERKIAR